MSGALLSARTAGRVKNVLDQGPAGPDAAGPGAAAVGWSVALVQPTSSSETSDGFVDGRVLAYYTAAGFVPVNYNAVKLFGLSTATSRRPLLTETGGQYLGVRMGNHTDGTPKFGVVGGEAGEVVSDPTNGGVTTWRSGIVNIFAQVFKGLKSFRDGWVVRASSTATPNATVTATTSDVQLSMNGLAGGAGRAVTVYATSVTGAARVGCVQSGTGGGTLFYTGVVMGETYGGLMLNGYFGSGSDGAGNYGFWVPRGGGTRIDCNRNLVLKSNDPATDADPDASQYGADLAYGVWRYVSGGPANGQALMGIDADAVVAAPGGGTLTLQVRGGVITGVV